MRFTLATMMLLLSAKAFASFTTTFEHVLSGKAPLSSTIVEEMYSSFLAEYKNGDHSLRSFLQSNGKDTIDRKALFEAQIQDVIAHNSNPSNKWQKGVNAFSDMTNEEFVQYYNIVKKD